MEDLKCVYEPGIGGLTLMMSSQQEMMIPKQLLDHLIKIEMVLLWEKGEAGVRRV